MRISCRTFERARKVSRAFAFAKQIEITLPVPSLDVDQAVVLVRKRAQRFRQRHELANAEGRLAGFRHEPLALDPDEVADVHEVEHGGLLRRQVLEAEIDLDAAGQVAQVEKMRATHVAVSGHAPGNAKNAAFRKFLPDVTHSAVRLESRSEGVDTQRAQRVKLLPARGKQAMGFGGRLVGAHLQKESCRRANGVGVCSGRRIAGADHGTHIAASQATN